MFRTRAQPLVNNLDLDDLGYRRYSISAPRQSAGASVSEKAHSHTDRLWNVDDDGVRCCCHGGRWLSSANKKNLDRYGLPRSARRHSTEVLRH
jgi:hypothetical protein